MEKLKANIIKIYGSRGECWIAGLSRSVDQLKTAWGLSKLKPLSNLNYSYVLEGFQGESPIVLKLSPDKDALSREIAALEVFKGLGAVAVLDYQDGALLLEKAIPGDCLKNQLPKEKRIAIACKVMAQLHRAQVPKIGNFPNMEEWLSTLDREWGLPKALLEKARKLKKELLKKYSEGQVLLHGDLHQENILAHKNTWIVIDPKGVVGAPIHEIWACVEDPIYDLQVLSDYFSYPFPEVVKWYYVHLMLAACWQVEDGLDAGRFLALAQSAITMIKC